VKHLTTLSEPKIIFTDLEMVDVIRDVIKDLNIGIEIVTFGALDGYLTFSNLMVPFEDEQDFE
jgi:hypothetical protein